MTNPTRESLEALAGGLTDAQRRAIRMSAPGAREMGGFGVIYDEHGNYRDPPLVERAGFNHPIFGSHWRLTPLGAALKSHLQENPHD